MDSVKPYLTLVNYGGGHEQDVAGHDDADGMAVWYHRPGEPSTLRPAAQIIVSTSDGPPDGRIIVKVVTSDRRVNVKAWGQTVCPSSYGQAGNVWTDNGSYRDPLSRAVKRDHPDDDNSACDICAANRAGFVATAAWLLIGATECPTVDAIAECLDLDLRTLYDEERDAWLDWHASHSVTCRACDAVNYADDVTDLYGGRCGNCAGTIHAVPEEDGDNEPLSLSIIDP